MSIYKKYSLSNKNSNKYSLSNKNSNKYVPYDKSLDNIFYACGLAMIFITAFLFLAKIIFGFDIREHTFPCMLHALTGYYCPGCGGTRATIMLFTGHVLKSIYYNPFVFYLAVTGGWFMISQTIFRLPKKASINFRPMTIRPSYIYIGIGILLVQCAIKNIILFIWGYSMF